MGGKNRIDKDLHAKFIGADNREEIAFASSNLPWLNKNTDNIRFIKATDDNKILIEDIAKMVDQSSKTKLWTQKFYRSKVSPILK
jgi:hypothetical protein